MRYIWPNLLSSLNIVLGAFGIYFSYNNRVDVGCFIILVASILDFFDGLIARAINGATSFGKELDSLADMVVFGILPSSILIVFSKSIFDNWIIFLGALPALTAGLRLAWFNISGSYKNYFRGVPTPATAILIASLFLVFLLELNVDIYKKETVYAWLSQAHSLQVILVPFVFLLNLFCNSYLFSVFCLIIGALHLIPLKFIKISPKIFLEKDNYLIILLCIIFLLMAVFYWKLTFSGIFYTLLFYILVSIFKNIGNA